MEIMKVSLEKEVKMQHQLLQQNLRMMFAMDKNDVVGSQSDNKALDADIEDDLEEEKELEEEEMGKKMKRNS